MSGATRVWADPGEPFTVTVARPGPRGVVYDVLTKVVHTSLGTNTVAFSLENGRVAVYALRHVIMWTDADLPVDFPEVKA